MLAGAGVNVARRRGGVAMLGGGGKVVSEDMVQADSNHENNNATAIKRNMLLSMAQETDLGNLYFARYRSSG